MADRSGYIGRAPGDSSVIIARKSYEPTGVQTDFTFNSGYTPGYCDVYLNGVKLIDEKDFTASNGSTVGLTSAAQSGDIVELVVYKAYNLGVPLADVTGNLDITGYVSASSSITAGGAFYGDGSNLSNIAGVAVTQYIAANSLTVIGSPGVSTITRLGVTDAVVTGIITANGLSGNVTGAAITITGNATFNSNVTIGGTLTYEDVTNVDALGIVTARAGVNVSGGELKVGSAVTVSGVGVATFVGAAGVAVTITPSTGKVQATTFEGPLTGNVTGGITAPSGASVTFADDINIASSDIVWDASANLLQFNDDIKATFGNSGVDLTIYHTNTGQVDRIDSGNKLEIRANASIDLSNEDGSSTYAFFNEAGSSDIYYNGSKKWETTNDGTVTTGVSTATGLSALGSAIYGIEARSNSTQATNTNKALRVRNNSDTNTFSVSYRGLVTAPDASITSNLIVGSGVTIGSAGVATFSGTADIHLHDNVKLNVGDVSGLAIYHDGSNSYLDNGSGGGELVPRSNVIRLRGKTANDTLAVFVEGAASELYFDASKKFQTTNDGSVTTGIGTFTEGLRLPDSKSLYVGTDLDLRFWHNGSSGYIANATGTLNISSADDGYIQFRGGTDQAEILMQMQDNAGVDLYYDNVKTFYTNTNGAIVQAGEGSDANLFFYADEGDDNADKWLVQAESDGYFALKNYASGSYEFSIKATGDAGVDLYHNNSVKLATTNDGAVITGITTFTKGCNFKGILKERHKQTDAKLSADVNIDLELGNVHYYSVNETTTATPNIRYNSSYSLNSKMNIGETISVTIIYKPNNAGYYAALNVDGSGVTEEWNGGDAPSSANSGGYDILTHTLLKVADANFLCFSNVQNYA